MSTYTLVSFHGDELPKEYTALIYSKWLRSFRHGNDFMKLVDSDAYYKSYHRYIEAMLMRPAAIVRLAVLSDNKDVVLGFSLARGNILDYVHVHKDQRRQGIGTSLVPDGIDTISHVTKTGLIIWGSKYGSWKFDPFS